MSRRAIGLGQFLGSPELIYAAFWLTLMAAANLTVCSNLNISRVA